MKRISLVAVAVVLFAAATTLHFEWREHYRCNACLSEKTTTEWRIGTTPLGYPILGPSYFTDRSFTISRKRETFRESRALQLFPPEHRHNWVFSQASPYYLFGTRWAGCSLGAPRRLSPFAYAYLNNPEFRVFVAERVAAGNLPLRDAARFFAYEPGASASSDPRFIGGLKLVREFQVTHHNPAFDETLERVVSSA